MSRLSVFIALVAFVTVTRADTDTFVHRGICTTSYCDCSDAIHPMWTTINCYVPNNTRFDVFRRDLPETTVELTIEGSEGIMFDQDALSGVLDLRSITINGAPIVVFRQYSAVGISVLNLNLEINDCDIVRFEKSTFVHLKGPLTVKIDNADSVFVEGDAFSWVLTMDISNVRELALGGGSFSLERTAANVGEHGPGMSIGLKNLTIPEFPRSAFGSSAAKIYMESVVIYAIRGGAFAANTYNIVMAINCSIHHIEEDAFSDNSLINYLNLVGCKIKQLSTRAIRCAIGSINITKTRFDTVETGAINTTVASVVISDNEFHTFNERAFQLSSCNTFEFERNSFDTLPPYAITAPGASIHDLKFNENEIEMMHPGSLGFIGNASEINRIQYVRNFYGIPCNCNISNWIADVFGAKSGEPYEIESYCTVDELIARCFNVPEQNMMFSRFIKEVCKKSIAIKCEKFRTKTNGGLTEIKNPRFPHKNVSDSSLSPRNKKIIGIVIVAVIGSILFVVLISLIRCLKRRGYCFSFKNLIMSSNSTCGVLCARICNCGHQLGHDNARSISALSVHEYSERHCLNEFPGQEPIQETSFQETSLDIVPTVEKFTQTLPEELTKELLDNLKERLDSPENYVEAREMIEHLYELTKMTEEMPKICSPTLAIEENIYEMPYHNTTGRIGKNNKKMVSIGTKAPSLEKLLPLSPYYRQTALAHEYFEPKDLAVHLYAEIANSDKEKKTLLGVMPDVIAEQAAPRGPYLRAVMHNPPTAIRSTTNIVLNKPRNTSTTKSTSSNSSVKMINRPLPQKPIVDPGEGTSAKHG